jgi:hypothetical protein
MTRLGLLERTIKLDEVVVTERKNPVKNSSNLNGAGNADFVLTAKDLSTCALLSQCLNGRIPFVIFRNGVPYSTRSPETPMTLIVDGMQLDPEFLDNLNATDIETIEVLEAMTEIPSLKDEELDVIGELISNMYGALEVHKMVAQGTDKKEALNAFMKRVLGSIDK